MFLCELLNVCMRVSSLRFVFELMCDVVCFGLLCCCVFVCGLGLIDVFVSCVCVFVWRGLFLLVWVLAFVCLRCCVHGCAVLGK